MNMKIHSGLLIAAAVVCSISVMPAFAKTAKEYTEEWRADKAGMQARGGAASLDESTGLQLLVL
jgi:hypothetical protein